MQRLWLSQYGALESRTSRPYGRQYRGLSVGRRRDRRRPAARGPSSVVGWRRALPAIIGYLEDVENYVAVDDPIYGKSDLTYDTLGTNYQGSGTWTHTYYTQA